MEHEAHVFFAVFEFGQDLDVVTKLAGVAPNESWVTGQQKEKHPHLTHRHSKWTIKSPLPLNAEVEDHLDALLSVMELHAAGIKAVSQRFPSEICCALYFHGCTPGFHLPNKLISRAAVFGLDVDFDLYCLGEEGERQARDSERS